ncbi:hypothetical protein HanXRQr2_Chr16g0755371 [Helianthus annuus]|uniref:Uncharacterized protein n=1 Tax=Helianthus annuus TaxID=4232 RepID=A0A9K3GYM3_HELAN|nr:hypothetical protein HanXRQr2_Chr16g0755371 [Helianthus annuus]KAJ0821752.1 hypothetical protein HanPSC8_Chr16g0723901 [Helianthus annuus]
MKDLGLGLYIGLIVFLGGKPLPRRNQQVEFGSWNIQPFGYWHDLRLRSWDTMFVDYLGLAFATNQLY